MNATNPKADAYYSNATKWQQELAALRAIALDCQLTEEVKWRVPCYTFEKSNIAIISGLKDYCAVSFFKGALLKDAKRLLVKPGENTQAGRLIRFTSVKEITKLKPTLKAYIAQAIEVEKAGLKVDFKNTEAIPVPAELQSKFTRIEGLKTAFDNLTPGRQRGYLLHFAAPKQSKTRATRVEKFRQQILDGKGLNDCTCGLSKKLPACDGSHKSLH